MATKAKPKKTTKKQHTPDYYPVQRHTPVGVNGGTITGTMAGDAGRILSQLNRRLYRYGNMYQIKIDLDVPGTLVAAPIDVEVYALRNNWDVQRAFALAKKTYMEATAHERNITTKGLVARWEDFRVDDGVAGANRIDAIVYDNSTLATNVVIQGEHVLSEVDKGGVDTFFTWGSSAPNALDIMDEWIRSGRTTTSPTPVNVTVPYDGVNSDELSNIEMENLGENGNEPPYGSLADSDQLVKVATLRYEPAADGLQRLSTGYFDAPCGLFVLKTAQNIANGTVTLTVKAGDYKGVSGHAMCS